MAEKDFARWVRRMSAKEKGQLIQKIEQAAYDCEKTYYGCARCTLKAVVDNLGIGQLEDGQLIKASWTLAGGIERSKQACGLLIGGAMAIGVVYSGGDKFETPFFP